MRIRGYTWLLAILALSIMALPALAQVKEDNATGTELPETLLNCDLTGYKSGEQVLVPATAIPDAPAAGGPGAPVVVGPLVIAADGSLINDVILELQAAHTWVGDLKVDVIYDLDCLQATPNVEMTALCRPKSGTAATLHNTPCGTGTGVGCSGNLLAANVYRFTDGTGTPMADLTAGCTTNIASGCFAPSPTPAAPGTNTFTVFNGLPKGGCWYLRAQDFVNADVGSISRWAIHILNSPTATNASSWGTVKTLYR
jgi:hypothetical protein